MFLILPLLLLIPTACIAHPSSIRSTPSFIRKHRVIVTSIRRNSSTQPYASRIPSVVKMRHIHDTISRSSASTLILHTPADVQYDVIDATGDIAGTNVTEKDSNLEANTSTEQDFSSSTPAGTFTSAPIVTEVSAALIYTQSNVASSNVSPDRTAVPVPTQSPRARLHPSVIPIFVGSAIGATSLLLVAGFVVCFCRRARAGASLQKKFNEKDKFIVSIRVPPPTVPLKGILLPSPPATSRSPSEPHSDRASLTSSQLSVIINNLPKSHDSGLENGALAQARREERNSPIRATRIGPSPSDFLANLFGQSHSFMSSNSASSQTSTSTTRSPPGHVQAPLTHYPRDFSSRVVDTHTPTFPPSAASPILGVSSGPRGHGLVLTGDHSVPLPSFAQWRYQRSVARSTDGRTAALLPF